MEDTPFELASGQWRNFIALKPYREFKRSQMRPGTRDTHVDYTLIDRSIALCRWLSQLQFTMAQHGLSLSELSFVLWILQCLEPRLRSLLERSLAKEVRPVGFNMLKLHLEVWAKVIKAPDHLSHWNRTTKGQVDIFEFWAGLGAQKHADLVRRWRIAWGTLSGDQGMFIPLCALDQSSADLLPLRRGNGSGTTIAVAVWKRRKLGAQYISWL
jgi:hypothetical protein